MATGNSSLTDIHAQLGEVRCFLLCTRGVWLSAKILGDAD
jgi:hypothetical protein